MQSAGPEPDIGGDQSAASRFDDRRLVRSRQGGPQVQYRLTALEYVDEFIAQSDVYPLAESQ
ncbi:MAG: hypothetical protein GY788_05720 [bacterium]|nr:hypothetical protein [bacterium]